MAILGHASKALRNSQNYLDGFDQSLELEPPMVSLSTMDGFAAESGGT
tara:strand:- start:85 stop:228 length:144 start_codon:yes stop_codon:yes gene_type:complete